MKKVSVFLVFLLVAFSLVGICNAQTKWESREEAEEFFSLNYQNINDHIYVPKYLKGYKPLSSDEGIIMFNDYTTVKMKIVGGVFWVIQKPQTRFVIQKKTKKIIRLEICGNKITGFKKLIMPAPTATIVEKSLAFRPEEGKNINININVSNSNPPVLPTTPNIEKSDFPWPTLIVATLTAVGLTLAYLLVDKHLENDKRENKSSTISGGGVLPPNKVISIGFTWTP